MGSEPEFFYDAIVLIHQPVASRGQQRTSLCRPSRPPLGGRVQKRKVGSIHGPQTDVGVGMLLSLVGRCAVLLGGRNHRGHC